MQHFSGIIFHLFLNKKSKPYQHEIVHILLSTLIIFICMELIDKEVTKIFKSNEKVSKLTIEHGTPLPVLDLFTSLKIFYSQNFIFIKMTLIQVRHVLFFLAKKKKRVCVWQDYACLWRNRGEGGGWLLCLFFLQIRCNERNERKISPLLLFFRLCETN